VIDKNGDIYQMVSDSDRAWHCMGANSNSIGIEHVAGEQDAMTAEQTKYSVALIRWLLAEYDIPRQSIYGHNFTPGYNRPGGTSCPDKLFGPAHTQQAVSDWVARNV
jgi:N-acetyl-anhydromuramyl-L-alanine amidase AmpD